MRPPGRALPLLPSLLVACAVIVGVAPGVPPVQAKTPVPTEEKAAETYRHFNIEMDDGGDKVGIGEDVTVGPEETVPGNVVCIGAEAKIEGTVRGDIVVIAGALALSGKAEGDVVGVVSHMSLAETSEIGGQLVNVAGRLDRRGARVEGQVVNISVPFLDLKSLAFLPALPMGLLGFIFFWSYILKLLLLFIAFLLLTALVPDRVRTLSTETPVRILPAFFVGILGYVVFLLCMILLILTCIGIPVALLLYFVFTVLKWLGLAGLFHQVGSRLGRMMGREMSLLGGVLLGFLPFAVLYFLPFCIGTIIWVVLDLLAIGLVILTRAGGQATPLAAVLAPVAPPPTSPAAAAPA